MSVVKVEAITSCVLQYVEEDGRESTTNLASGDTFIMGPTPPQIDVRCQYCGDQWLAHHEWLETEDDERYIDIPCIIEGCDCQVYMEFTPLRSLR